jgi:hypothetical protein
MPIFCYAILHSQKKSANILKEHTASNFKDKDRTQEENRKQQAELLPGHKASQPKEQYSLQ